MSRERGVSRCLWILGQGEPPCTWRMWELPPLHMKEHQAIYSAIRERRPAKAKAAMKKHHDAVFGRMKSMRRQANGSSRRAAHTRGQSARVPRSWL